MEWTIEFVTLSRFFNFITNSPTPFKTFFEAFRSTFATLFYLGLLLHSFNNEFLPKIVCHQTHFVLILTVTSSNSWNKKVQYFELFLVLKGVVWWSSGLVFNHNTNSDCEKWFFIYILIWRWLDDNKTVPMKFVSSRNNFIKKKINMKLNRN